MKVEVSELGVAKTPEDWKLSQVVSKIGEYIEYEDPTIWYHIIDCNKRVCWGFSTKKGIVTEAPHYTWKGKEIRTLRHNFVQGMAVIKIADVWK